MLEGKVTVPDAASLGALVLAATALVRVILSQRRVRKAERLTGFEKLLAAQQEMLEDCRRETAALETALAAQRVALEKERAEREREREYMLDMSAKASAQLYDFLVERARARDPEADEA